MNKSYRSLLVDGGEVENINVWRGSRSLLGVRSMFFCLLMTAIESLALGFLSIQNTHSYLRRKDISRLMSKETGISVGIDVNIILLYLFNIFCIS